MLGCDALPFQVLCSLPVVLTSTPATGSRSPSPVSSITRRPPALWVTAWEKAKGCLRAPGEVAWQRVPWGVRRSRASSREKPTSPVTWVFWRNACEYDGDPTAAGSLGLPNHPLLTCLRAQLGRMH